MLSTRPDTCFSISFFSQFAIGTSDHHFKHLLRVLKYLFFTKARNFTYTRKATVVSIIEIYSDAGWGNCPETSRAFSGAVVFVCGNLTNWYSKKQSSVALSSTESEIVAVCEAIPEAIWTRRQLLDLGKKFDENSRCIIYEDNQSCLKFIADNWNSKRSKHADVKYRFIRDIVEAGLFKFKYVESSCQLTNVFTKNLSQIKFLT